MTDTAKVRAAIRQVLLDEIAEKSSDSANAKEAAGIMFDEAALALDGLQALTALKGIERYLERIAVALERVAIGAEATGR
ncbi:MAG: hypothetical protein ACREQ5_24530 [Candidatus Dormibacteria bacterium]